MLRFLFFLFMGLGFMGCSNGEVAFSSLPLDTVVGLDDGILGLPDGIGHTPPSVRVTRHPRDQVLGEDNFLNYEIIPGSENVEFVDCYLDQQPLNCSIQGGRLDLKNPSLGSHRVHIVARDERGFMGQYEKSWMVHQLFEIQSTNISVGGGQREVDIVVVIDNSQSMVQEQRGIGRKVQNLFRKLSGLNWRLAMVTTDPRPSKVYGDGKLLRFPNGSYFLTSELSGEDAKNQFSQTIFRSETSSGSGSGNERGIRAVYRSIERSVASVKNFEDQRLANFFRQEASLSVVMISDETEALIPLKGSVEFSDVHKSQGDRLVSLVQSTWGPSKVFQFNSIITVPGDLDCLESAGRGGTGLSFGVAYEALSLETGGAVGSICSSDYSATLSHFGTKISNLQSAYGLNCEPQDTDGDGAIDFQVDFIGLFNPLDSIPSYSIRGKEVQFDSRLPQGDYRFTYSCLNTVD